MPDWTIHGGRLPGAQRAFPQAPLPWLDLSTGINPVCWPGVAAIDIDWRGLPDEEGLRTLEATAAVCFGARDSDICALPGTEQGLRSLGALGLPGPFRHVVPGYGSHGDAFPGSVPIAFDAVADDAARGGTILLANPANPDGRRTAVRHMLQLAGRIGDAGGWLVVDEAFIDAHDGGSIIPALDAAAPVIVLRSFGKFFGLAGVRLGFAVGRADVIARWRARIGSWPVSAAAIAIGTAAYADRGWIGTTRVALDRRALALDALLRRHGLEPTGTCPLFRLIDCAAGQLFDRLARRGILTRPFDYAPRWLRLGVPGHGAALARLDQALADG